MIMGNSSTKDSDNYQKMQTPDKKGPKLKKKATFFNSKRSTKGWCTKKIYNFFKAIFKHLYPSKMKKAWSKYGKWLRSVIGWTCFLHCLFFTFSLAFVGFKPMIVNLFLSMWCYSAYLTLRYWIIIFHLIFLISASSGGCYDVVYQNSGKDSL